MTRRTIDILIIGFFATLLALTGCSTGDDIKSADQPDSTVAIVRPDQMLLNARITLYDGSLRTTDLFADSIEKYEKSDSSLAWNLIVHFFDSLGQEVSNLEADSGLVREKTNFMEVFGNVVVRTSDSAVLHTEQLAYNAELDSITTDKFVHIVQQGDTIKGYGMVADKELKKIRILRQVTGTLKSSKQILD